MNENSYRQLERGIQPTSKEDKRRLLLQVETKIGCYCRQARIIGI
jgi:hypothetical protein